MSSKEKVLVMIPISKNGGINSKETIWVPAGTATPINPPFTCTIGDFFDL